MLVRDAWVLAPVGVVQIVAGEHEAVFLAKTKEIAGRPQSQTNNQTHSAREATMGNGHRMPHEVGQPPANPRKAPQPHLVLLALAVGQKKHQRGGKAGSSSVDRRPVIRPPGQPSKAVRITPAAAAAAKKPPTPLSDQDVLIAFGALLRLGNEAAVEAHKVYKASNDMATFMRAARMVVKEAGDPIAQPTANPLRKKHASDPQLAAQDPASREIQGEESDSKPGTKVSDSNVVQSQQGRLGGTKVNMKETNARDKQKTAGGLQLEEISTTKNAKNKKLQDGSIVAEKTSSSTALRKPHSRENDTVSSERLHGKADRLLPSKGTWEVKGSQTSQSAEHSGLTSQPDRSPVPVLATERPELAMGSAESVTIAEGNADLNAASVVRNTALQTMSFPPGKVLIGGDGPVLGILSGNDLLQQTVVQRALVQENWPDRSKEMDGPLGVEEASKIGMDPQLSELPCGSPQTERSVSVSEIVEEVIGEEVESLLARLTAEAAKMAEEESDQESLVTKGSVGSAKGSPPPGLSLQSSPGLSSRSGPTGTPPGLSNGPSASPTLANAQTLRNQPGGAIPVNPLLGGPHGFGRLVPQLVVPPSNQDPNIPAPMTEPARDKLMWKEYNYHGRKYYSNGQLSVWEPPLEFLMQQQIKGLKDASRSAPETVEGFCVEGFAVPQKPEPSGLREKHPQSAFSSVATPGNPYQQPTLPSQNPNEGLKRAPPPGAPSSATAGLGSLQTSYPPPGLYQPGMPVVVHPLQVTQGPYPAGPGPNPNVPSAAPPHPQPLPQGPQSALPHPLPTVGGMSPQQLQEREALLNQIAQAFGENGARHLLQRLASKRIPATADEILRFLARHPDDLSALLEGDGKGAGAGVPPEKPSAAPVTDQDPGVPGSLMMKRCSSSILEQMEEGRSSNCDPKDSFSVSVEEPSRAAAVQILEGSAEDTRQQSNSSGEAQVSTPPSHAFLTVSSEQGNAQSQSPKTFLLNMLWEGGNPGSPKFMFGDGSDSLKALARSPTKSEKQLSHGDFTTVTEVEMNTPRACQRDAAPNIEDLRTSLIHRGPKRTTHEKAGKIILEFEDGIPIEIPTVRPQSQVQANWELPEDVLDEQGEDLVMGLFHIGAPINSSAIISKKLQLNRAKPLPTNGNNRGVPLLFGGYLPFYFPKSVGVFVFRIFNKEDPVRTLAFSAPVNVTVQGKEAERAIRFVLQQLRGQGNRQTSGVGAINQLTRVVEGLRKSFPDMNQNIGEILWNAVCEAYEIVITEYEIALEDAKMQDTLAADFKSNYTLQESSRLSGSKGPPSRIDWADTDHRHLSRVHGAFRDLMCACEKNCDLPWLMPKPSHPEDCDPLEEIQYWQSLWCPIYELYFPNEHGLLQHHKLDIGFCPAIPQRQALYLNKIDPSFCLTATSVHNVHSKVFDLLTEGVKNVLPALIPSAEFFQTREGVRNYLERILVTMPFIPNGTTLTVFGSSANNFGSNSSDLDMCLVFPSSEPYPENPGEVISKTADVLKGLGMFNVECRSTARIPIVLFGEPNSGLDCDISLHNPLALANTALLASYSRIDPRVRALAYIIKHWAKQRRMNNGSEGTLSSYGYLLCLIHFLQTRPTPLLPNLQNLPPDWDPETHKEHELEFERLPVVETVQNIDNRVCNTYFFVPRDNDYSQLERYARQNTESIGQLLFGFFQYYSNKFDHRHSVVSVRTGCALHKEVKAEQECWPMHTRLSIEDPFEVWYDVAHVLKFSRDQYIRKEYNRAYSLILDANRNISNETDISHYRSLFSLICEEAPTPSFLRQRLDESVEEEEVEVDSSISKLLEEPNEIVS